jgi:hypothetical protein
MFKLVVLICGCGDMEPFLVGEHNALWIRIVIWTLHLGHNNEMVARSIAGHHQGSRGFTLTHVTSICGIGQQMVMVTKVIWEDTMFSNKVKRLAKITTLDEACVPPMANKTYILWSTTLIGGKIVMRLEMGVNKQWSLFCKILLNSILNFMSYVFSFLSFWFLVVFYRH